MSYCEKHDQAWASSCCGAGAFDEVGIDDGIGLCLACHEWAQFTCAECDEEGERNTLVRKETA